MKPFVGGLEGLRGYAALLMVVYHAWVLTGGPLLGGGRALLSGGFLAVDLFFVLSAFVLTLPAAHSGEFGSWREYALRRAARIVPAYYAALAVALLLFHPLAGPVADRRPPTIDALLAHLSFLQVEARLLPGYDGALGFRVDPPLWTLSVEVAFYVVLPLIVLGFLRRPVLWLCVTLVGIVALRGLALGVFDGATEDRLLSLPPMYAADFAAGMAGAWLYARGVRIKAWPAVVAVLGAVAVLYASGGATADAARLGARQSLWLAVATPVAFGALVLTATNARWADNTPARWLGKVSYGVFLFHFMVMLLLVNGFGVEREFWLVLPLGLAGSLAAGYASWRLIEAPARRRVRQAQLTYAAR
ncbi:acyltransferase family protein [Solirubrobacter soli]|uniref:acyltransferase family protein n=1 Tax=Solirubrobacter soli TaxID=363832 RepID=UPI000420CAE4|nr:acyltransferase [Solirubrobacter soli]